MLKYILTLLTFLSVLYFGMFFVSVRGWGYNGYGNYYHHRPSFFYFSGPQYYPNKSIRNGSIGGTGAGGGGFHSGK